MARPDEAEEPAAALAAAGEKRPGVSQLVAVLALVAVLVALYFPLFLGRILYQRDLSLWTLPARSFVRASLAAGEPPLWNPYVGLGLSTLANPLYGLFYPPNLLHLLGPLPIAVTWVSWLHLVAGGLGTLLLLRRLGADSVAALVAGIAWSASGFLSSMWTFGILLLVFAWTPYCALGFVALWSAGDSRRGGRVRGIAWAAAPVAMALLSGEVFLALVSAGFGVAVASVRWLASREARSGSGSSPALLALVGSTAAALVLAAALGAVTVWPAVRGASATERSQPLSAELAEQGSFHPWRLVELAASGLASRAFEANPDPVMARLGGLHPLASSVYMGGAVLALAALALGRARRLPVLLALLGALSLAMAMGRYTPVHAVGRWMLPPLAFMRFPEKYLVLPFGFFALLAGLGAQRLMSAAHGEPVPWKRLAGLVLLLLGLAGGGGWFLPVELAAFARAGALQSAAAAAAVLGILFLRRSRPALGGALLVSVVAVDLMVAAVPVLRWTSPEAVAVIPPVVTVVRGEAKALGSPAPPRVYRSPRLQASVSPRGRGEPGQLTSVQTLRENTASMFGIAVLPGYDAALSPSLSRILGLGRTEVLRLVGAELALLPVDAGARGRDSRADLLPLFDPVPGARLYRVPAVLPRVYLASAASVLDEDAAGTALLDPAVLAGHRVVLSPDPPPPLPLPDIPGREGPPGACALVSFAGTRIEATCETTRPAIAVFLEQYDRGWKAAVDGSPVPLLRANLVMRAVSLPGGSHRVTLQYQPAGLATGAAVSVLAALVWLGLLLAGRGRRGFLRRDRTGLQPTPSLVTNA